MLAPAWVPEGWVWRLIVVGIIVGVSLVVSNVVTWKLQDDKSCAARRDGALDTAEAVLASRDDFADPNVDAGLESIARRIRQTAEEC